MADGAAQAETEKSKSSMDFPTIIGLVSGFGLVAITIFIGGSPDSFFNIPAMLIVIGGTLAVTTMCFSHAEMGRTGRVVVKTLFFSSRNASEAAIHVLQIAKIARKQGVLWLQNTLESLQGEPFLLKGISMGVDGTPDEKLEAIKRRDILATVQRHTMSGGVLRKAAEFAPTMGLIGTLIGLVQMLGNLDDPSNIAPIMAVALLTPFYGAVLANMVFSSLASKLGRNSVEEALINTIYVMGTASVRRQENPRRLEMLLNSVLPPSKRVRYFE